MKMVCIQLWRCRHMLEKADRYTNSSEVGEVEAVKWFERNVPQSVFWWLHLSVSMRTINYK